jgi:CMP-N-acetylneuraminic acid synthetase/spore coat polysaccharide biosynthesis predicted glycosyltransferase SpsG
MRVLAIIPARGGSKAIPRKNVRMIGGVPLIAHAIRACHASARITRTVISTEDEEVAVAARRFGAEVLMRPSELSGDSVPLAPVVYHAVNTLEAAGERFDVVMTVQPTSPLIRPASLDRGLALFEDADTDTVLSAYDNTHLSWTLDDTGRPVPMYAERVNRQALPKVYTESGGLIASRRTCVTPDERIGQCVQLVVLDPDEAIDIDTYHDWWLAEKIINRRRIVFNLIGSRMHGLGHVNRALTLARRLTDHHLLFIADQREELAARGVQDHHYTLETYADDPLPLLERLQPDIVVNDVLDTSADLVRAMKQRGWRVVNFEDQGPGIDHADAVINALYEGPHPADHVYCGADYYCLREEFFSIRRRDAQPVARTVLICFGGTDPAGLTVKTARVAAGLPAGFRLVIVLGPGFGHDDELARVLTDFPHAHEIVRDTKVISHYMEQADVMVTSGGRTCYEAATVGVPAVVMCQNDRELKHVFASPDHGFINLGLGRDVADARLAEVLGHLMGDEARRRAMQHRMWEWDGRGGIDRVLKIIIGDEVAKGIGHGS